MGDKSIHSRSVRKATLADHGSLPIRTWPSDERPRERLVERGAGDLSDAQLVAILLRSGRRRQTALDLARIVLTQFGGLSGMAHASVAELCRVGGIGPAKAAQLKAAQEIGRRIAATPLGVGASIESSETVFKHFAPLMRGVKKEIFRGLYLDGKHRLVLDRTISEGTLTASLVHPREAFLPAIQVSAAAVIFLHNHPSGDVTPSREDRELTSRLAACGRLLGIPMLDHLVIGTDTYFSFADHRLVEDAR